jgi:hypothetical protein
MADAVGAVLVFFFLTIDHDDVRLGFVIGADGGTVIPPLSFYLDMLSTG